MLRTSYSRKDVSLPICRTRGRKRSLKRDSLSTTSIDLLSLCAPEESPRSRSFSSSGNPKKLEPEEQEVDAETSEDLTESQSSDRDDFLLSYSHKNPQDPVITFLPPTMPVWTQMFDQIVVHSMETQFPYPYEIKLSSCMDEETIANSDCIVCPYYNYNGPFSDLYTASLDMVKFLGKEIQANIERVIERDFCGELPVGQTLLFRTKRKYPRYILLVMVAESPQACLQSPEPAYNATRAVLLAIRNNNLRSRDTIKKILWPCMTPVIEIDGNFNFFHAVRGMKRGLTSVSDPFGQTLSAVKKAKKNGMLPVRQESVHDAVSKSTSNGEIQRLTLHALESAIMHKQLAMRGIGNENELKSLLEIIEDDTNHRLQKNAGQQFLRLMQSWPMLSPLDFPRQAAQDFLFKNFPKAVRVILGILAADTECMRENSFEIGDDVKKGDLIAMGSSASVFHAELSRGDVQVVMKVFAMPLENESEFSLECFMNNMLNHPNIVKYYGHGVFNTKDEYNRRPFIVMEWMEGGTLYDRLHKSKVALSPSEKLKISTDVCLALQYLHAYGILHRDIKSTNIMLTSGGTAKLGDLGSACENDNDRLKTSNVGTCSWMSPEVMSSQSYTEKVDIYSFAMVLYEIFEEKIPFKEHPIHTIPRMILKGVRPKMTKTPKYIQVIIKEMWHEKAAKRPTATAILKYLSAAPESSP